MYLTITHPELLKIFEKVPHGIIPVKSGNDVFLVVKAPKELILTARTNKGFLFYLAPIALDDNLAFTLITAFFDDHDEPLVIITPLLANDALTDDLLALFQKIDFEVFFFDEHNREHLSYKASGNLPSLYERIGSNLLSHADSLQLASDLADDWFGKRTSGDDNEAIEVNLIESLFPDDVYMMDLTTDKHQFRGSNSYSTTSLERTEPGAYQELDIVFLLQRVFESNRIFLSPVKVRDNEELVDILVVGEFAAFLFQAKDSPNTEKTLRTSIGRKRIKSSDQVKHGLSQLAGAISEIKRNPLIHLRTEDITFQVDFNNRALIGIVVVKELFMDMYDAYSRNALELALKVETPVVFFDYPELNTMTLHCASENKYLSAIEQVFSTAIQNGAYPKLRFSGKPS